MKTLRILAVSSLLMFPLIGVAGSQPTIAERSEIPPGPRTKLEARLETSGAVLIRQFTQIGSIGRGVLNVAAIIVTNTRTGIETKGLLVSPSETLSGKGQAYVDYDEISGLLSSIDELANVELTTLKLANGEAIYHTRGNLRVAAYSEGDSKRASISTGKLPTDTIQIEIKELSRFRDLIRSAKRILDNPDFFDAKDNRQVPESSLKPEGAKPEIFLVPSSPKFRSESSRKLKGKGKAKFKSEPKAKAKTKVKANRKPAARPSRADPFPKPI